MKTKYLKLGILSLFILTFSSLMATGPSFIRSEMKPVSINSKGEILCRTRFMKNDMGADYFQPTTYGYCVITNGKIIRYGEITIEPGKIENHDDLMKEFDKMDKLFDSPIDFEKKTPKEKDICSFYGFASNNVEQYKVGKDMHITNFEKNKSINLKTTKQLALNGATSNEYCKEKIVHIAYDFKHILILSNKLNYGEEEVCVGADFNYQNSFTKDGKTINVGYEMGIISGVLFK